MRLYRCRFCGFKLPVDRSKKGEHSPKYKMGLHYETKHKELLPSMMDGFKFFYYTITGKERGSCVICHKPTEFNRTTMKYSRFCNDPKCKEAYKKQVDERMIKKYGKVCLLDSPEIQKKMLAARRISGEYTWSDGKTKFQYTGSYELDFLKHLDNDLKWPASDLIMPSPHLFTYQYQGKDHFYIPDAFIPSRNLQIEIKDGGAAKNIGQETRDKERLKDELMRSCSNLYNYIKIEAKDYNEFNELVSKGDNE